MRPVFFYDAGERGVSNDTVLVVLAEHVGPSAPMALVRKYNGVAVMWEHRFYGESLPFKVDNVTGYASNRYDAYKYLANEQIPLQPPRGLVKGLATANDGSMTYCLHSWRT